jgi:hypothetical protein
MLGVLQYLIFAQKRWSQPLNNLLDEPANPKVCKGGVDCLFSQCGVTVIRKKSRGESKVEREKGYYGVKPRSSVDSQKSTKTRKAQKMNECRVIAEKRLKSAFIRSVCAREACATADCPENKLHIPFYSVAESSIMSLDTVKLSGGESTSTSGGSTANTSPSMSGVNTPITLSAETSASPSPASTAPSSPAKSPFSSGLNLDDVKTLINTLEENQMSAFTPTTTASTDENLMVVMQQVTRYATNAGFDMKVLREAQREHNQDHG